MLNYQKEAITCYQQCLDDVPPDTPLQKQLHACALNNLATVYEDVSQKQQALQHYSGALALNSKCHVAAKNRANMHLSHAKKLQSTGINGAAAAQHEIAYNMYNRSLDVDWQLPTVFFANDVPVRLETRVVRGREVYHCSTNLTHLRSKHL